MTEKNNKSTGRRYDLEYQNYQGTEEQKKRRAKRNNARRKLEREGKVSKGDGKDVDHRNGNPNDNSTSNLIVKDKSDNRSYPRTKKAKKKNPKD